jgi:hypothetical protein
VTSTEAYRPVRTGTRRERVAAAAGLALAVLLLRLPFRHTVRAARWARLAGRRPLDLPRAEALASAIRHAGRWWPGRIACLERSLGTMLAAALLGRELTWCLGARLAPPPTEYHAWVERPGHGPVAEHTTAGWHHHAALRV